MRAQGPQRRPDAAIAAVLIVAILGVASVATAFRLPTINISSPAPSSVVEGTTTIRGTARSGSYTLSRIDVGVDGASFRRASGTATWSVSLNTASFVDGAHTVNVRATDRRGHQATVNLELTFQNSATTADPSPSPTPTPTPTPSPAPSPTPSPSASPSPTVSPSASPTDQVYTTPEGATIEINSAGGWTYDTIYQLLKENGLDSTIGPTLTVKVQDTYGSQVTTSAGTGSDGRYNNFHATMYLLGVNSTLNTQPDAAVGHEYGHVYTLYYLYMAHNGDWTSYLQARGLYGNPNLDTSYPWMTKEIAADDYRLLLGAAAAISENPQHLNTQIPDPRNVAGLKDFLQTTWKTPS